VDVLPARLLHGVLLKRETDLGVLP
jgi:hypothetical protein